MATENFTDLESLIEEQRFSIIDKLEPSIDMYEELFGAE